MRKDWLSWAESSPCRSIDRQGKECRYSRTTHGAVHASQLPHSFFRMPTNSPINQLPDIHEHHIIIYPVSGTTVAITHRIICTSRYLCSDNMAYVQHARKHCAETSSLDVCTPGNLVEHTQTNKCGKAFLRASSSLTLYLRRHRIRFKFSEATLCCPA